MNQPHQTPQDNAPQHQSQSYKDGRVRDLTTLLGQAIDALAGGSPALEQEAGQLREMVSRPPRVAIVGRLKSGKSTLVNALTENRIAATGTLECTMAVSLYRNGAPARAEIHGSDGRVDRIPLGAGPLTEMTRPLDEIDYVDQFLPNARLQQLTLIDTPGTATLTVENEARTRRVLVDGAQDTQRASSWADSLVFLSDSAPREDERLFLSKLGMTPLTTVGVLSRADSFGAGAFGPRDPMEHAREHAERIASGMDSTVFAMVPLSGLLAESALTGTVTEDAARKLGALASLDREQLLDVVELDDPSRVVEGLTPQVRDQLLDIFGEYGLMAGRRIAAEQGASGLLNWMVQTSGVAELTRILTGDITYFAVIQRAVRVLDVLDDLASNHPDREHVRWVQSVTLSQPGMHFVMLYRSFRDTYASTPDSRLLPWLQRAIEGTHPAEVVGLPTDAPTQEVIAAIENQLGELQQMSMSPLSAAEDEARERLVGACQAALQAAKQMS